MGKRGKNQRDTLRNFRYKWNLEGPAKKIPASKHIPIPAQKSVMSDHPKPGSLSGECPTFSNGIVQMKNWLSSPGLPGYQARNG